MTETATKYANMTDAELYCECAKVVEHMATQLISITKQQSALFQCKDESIGKFATAAIQHSMPTMMNGLGDILNAMDAVEESDSWTDPLFEELHIRTRSQKTCIVCQKPLERTSRFFGPTSECCPEHDEDY